MKEDDTKVRKDKNTNNNYFYLSLLFKIILIVFSIIILSSSMNTIKAEVVRVGFFHMDGYHMIDEDGKKSGYGYDLLQKLSRYLPYTFEYVGYDKSWSEMQDMLENGDIDILTSAAKTPYRESRFEFSKNAIGSNYTILTTKDGNDRIVSKDYSTYDGMRVGLLEKSTKNNLFESFSKEKGFSYEPIFYSDYTSMNEDLQKGEIDAIVSSNLRSLNNECIIEQFGSSDFFIIAPKGEREILDAFDRALEELEIDEPGWRNALMYQSYYDSDSSSFSLHGDEAEYFKTLKEEGRLFRVAVSPDRKPYSYFVNGEAKGIIPSIFRVISEKIGFDYTVIETRTREEYLSLLESGEVDIIMDAPYDHSSLEDMGYKITDSFMSTGISEITRSGYVGSIKSASMVESSTLIRSYMEKYFDFIEFKYFESIDSCVQAVKNGEVDASFLYTYVVQDIIDSDSRSTFSSRVLSEVDVSFAVAVRNDEKNELIKAINRAIGAMRNNEIVGIILRETERTSIDDSFISFLYRHPFILFSLILVTGVFIVIGFLLISSIVARRRLGKANQKLLEANEAKRDFLSKMSHDMRTPMNAIKGFTGIARKDEDITHIKEYLEKIDISSDHLLSLINDCLDINKIESGGIIYKKETTDIKGVIDSVMSITDGLLAERHLTFLKEGKIKEDRRTVLTDGVWIKEILVNLIGNAIKFTEDGGTVVFSIDEIDGDDGVVNLVFSVSDNGCGMDESYLPHVFDVFSQEDNGARTRYKGSGLGLAISKKYVDLMGGRISIESKKGEGSRFTLEIPVTLCSSNNNETATSMMTDLSLLKGKRVLLAEDNDLNAEIVEIQLEEYGMVIDRARNGKEALDAFLAKEPDTYSVILMDIMMPVMDGLEATKEIRKSRVDGKSIPIIAMTANAFNEDVETSMKAGMNAHIVKPIDIEKLVSTILLYVK